MNTSTRPIRPTPGAPGRRTSTVRAVAAATIGNALEWFDLAIYALMAIYIGQVFFPQGAPGVQTLSAFAVFGATYLIRPLGGLVLGAYADRHGRTKALVLTIWLMVLGTFLMATMPGYETLGVAATVGMVVARLIQGFAAGGEFGAATSFLVEQQQGRKAFFGSFQFASQGLATLLSAGFAAGLTSVLTQEQMLAWGWRVPFFFGLLIGPVGWYIRRNVADSPEMQRHEARADAPQGSPIIDVFRRHWGGLLIAGGALVVSTALNFILQYLPTFAISRLHIDPSLSFTALLVTGVILTLGTPLVGLLADRVGRLRVMLPAAVAIGVLTIPLFMWVTNSPSFVTLTLVMTILGLMKALYFGALPSVMSDAFPVEARATGLSFSYNATVSVFGGFTPTIATALVTLTGSDIAPAYYLLVLSLISICALLAGFRLRGIR